jgi:hypothetical protein
MRTVVLLCLLLLACAPRSVDVLMNATSTPGVFSYKGVGTLSAPIPGYPEGSRLADIEGLCRVTLRFTTCWSAESVKVAKESGNRWLDDSSCAAGAGVVLAPAARARRRTPVHADIDYRFTLLPGAAPAPDSGREGLVEVTQVRLWTE